MSNKAKSGSRETFADAQIEFALAQMTFEPAQIEFAPAQMTFEPAQIESAPAQMIQIGEFAQEIVGRML